MLKVRGTSHHHRHHLADCSAKETRRTNNDKRQSLSNKKKRDLNFWLALSKLSEAEAEIAKQERVDVFQNPVEKYLKSCSKA